MPRILCRSRFAALGLGLLTAYACGDDATGPSGEEDVELADLFPFTLGRRFEFRYMGPAGLGDTTTVELLTVDEVSGEGSAGAQQTWLLCPVVNSDGGYTSWGDDAGCDEWRIGAGAVTVDMDRSGVTFDFLRAPLSPGSGWTEALPGGALANFRIVRVSSEREVGGRLYSDVVELRVSPSGASGITFLVARGFGILSYQEDNRPIPFLIVR